MRKLPGCRTTADGNEHVVVEGDLYVDTTTCLCVAFNKELKTQPNVLPGAPTREKSLQSPCIYRMVCQGLNSTEVSIPDKSLVPSFPSLQH